LATFSQFSSKNPSLAEISSELANSCRFGTNTIKELEPLKYETNSLLALNPNQDRKLSIWISLMRKINLDFLFKVDLNLQNRLS